MFAPRGIFGRGFPGAMGGGIVATPEQRDESERMSAMLGGRGHPEVMQNGPQLTPPQHMPQQPRMSTGRRIAGIASDFLSGMAGGPAHFAEGQQRHQQAIQEAEQRRQQMLEQRAYEATEWQRRQEYERANPNPIAPTEFERTVAAAGHAPGSEEYRRLMRDYAESRANPLAYLPNGNGTFTPVPRGGTPPTGQSNPPLVNSPEEARRLPPGTQFRTPDGRTGRTASQGGATPTGSGNFPR